MGSWGWKPGRRRGHEAAPRPLLVPARVLGKDGEEREPGWREGRAGPQLPPGNQQGVNCHSGGNEELCPGHNLLHTSEG